MLTMAPPVSRISGTAALVMMKGPVRFTAMTSFQASSGVSISGPKWAMPALLTSASSRPKRARTASTAAATSAGCETSLGSARILSGWRKAAAAASSTSVFQSSMATDQPSARKRAAAA